MNPAAASSLTLSAPATATAGSAFSVTVTAKDLYSNVATGYTGTVSFSGGGSGATLPSNYPFVAGDNGVHTFTNGVTLRTAGLGLSLEGNSRGCTIRPVAIRAAITAPAIA